MGIVTGTTRTSDGGNSINGLSRDSRSGNLGFKGTSTGRSDRGESGDGYIGALLRSGPGGSQAAVGPDGRPVSPPTTTPNPSGGAPIPISPNRPNPSGPGGGRNPTPGAAPIPLVQPPEPIDTSWASRMPLDFSELLRQLSANVGKPAMPGGMGGAVRVPSFPGYGQNTPDLPNPIDPSTYGQDGGEATFFTQAIGGGMTPLYAMQDGLGISSAWDPLGSKAAAAAAAAWKKGKPIPNGWMLDPTGKKLILKPVTY